MRPLNDYLFPLVYKKGVGALSLAHPGTTGSRIASPHRIDNAVSPRQYELYIIWVYRNAPRRRLGCHLSAVAWNLRDS